MTRDPKKDNLNWGLEWADYLTSQRDFIVGRVEKVLDPGQMSVEEQEELGKATVTRSLAVLRSYHVKMAFERTTGRSVNM